MPLTKELVLQKFKTYGKLKRYYRIFKNPDLKMYFDSHLYRNLLTEGSLSEPLYTFPTGAHLLKYDADIEVVSGRLNLGAFDGASALKEESFAEPSSVDMIQQTFTSDEWSFVAVFTDVGGYGDPTAILDLSDGNQGYFRLAVDDSDNLRILHCGARDLEEPEIIHTSDPHSLVADDDVFVFVTIRDGRILGYINGIKLLDEEFSGYALGPILMLVGGSLSSMSLDESCAGQLGLLAMYSCSLSDNEMVRYMKIVNDIFPDSSFNAG
jgi:hypothetical protein